MRHLFIIIILFFAFSNLQSQSTRKYEVAGDKAFEQQNYSSAVYFYSMAANTKASSAVAWKLAESARLNRDYKLAEKWYAFVATQSNNKQTLAYYYLANVQKSMGLYQKASVNFKNSYNLLKNNNDYYQKKSRHEISACEKALFLTFEPVTEEFNLVDSIFQSEYSEFQMHQLNDSLRWITVLRPEDSPDTVQILSRAVQYTKKQNPPEWEKTSFFNNRINIPGSHTSSLTIDTTLKIIVNSISVTAVIFILGCDR